MTVPPPIDAPADEPARELVPEAPRLAPPIPGRGPVTSRVEAHALAGEIARQHGDALLRTARKVSVCADDAHDAYQRGLELLLEHAMTIDRIKAVGWMHVVVRREALAIRRGHDRSVPFDDAVHDRGGGRHSARPDERLDAIDIAQRAGEALATLKDAEAKALCLRAQGMSYAEIGEHYGWSYTKVNRAVSEGRRAFVDHYTAVERGHVCAETGPLVERFVAGELSARHTMRVRAHLVRCSGCRQLLHAQRSAEHALRALLPPAAIAAVAGPSGGGWLHEHLLGPAGQLAGRLQPATEPLLGSKAGIAAASTLAIAGGGVAAERQLADRPAPPPLRSSVISAAPSAGSPAGIAPPAGIAAVVNAGAGQGEALTREAQRRAAAAKRRAARAERARAREARANNDFAVAGGEFAGGGGNTGSAGSGGSRATGTGTAPLTTETAAPPPAEVVTTDDGGGASDALDVAVDDAGGGSTGSVSDEFGR